MPLPEPAGPPRGRHATPLGQNFEQVVGWTILGSLIPGAGLIAAGRQAAGRLALAVSGLVILGACVGYLMIDDPIRFAASFIADPNKILIAAGLFVLLVLGWIAMVISTHNAARRYGNLTGGQRVLASALVTALIAAIAVPTAFGAQGAWKASDTIRSVFQDTNSPLNKDAKGPDAGNTVDPWADVPRVNVLLMGGDSGKDRIAIRPDTMIVASIDTKTGRTTLISLPRNLQRVPFPRGSKGKQEFPDGFYCLNSQGDNTECLLNALWTWGDGHPAYYPGDKHPGLTATVEAIEQLTGLTIDQYVMLNLEGFSDFVNAIGGVTINAKTAVPIGGHGNLGEARYSPPTSWITPGKKHMDGYHALWYARARQYSGDFDRMQRQRCVIGAVIGQANPTALALGFTKIMDTLSENLITSIPLKDVDAWVTLALRVKKAKITSLAFTDTVINTARPDVEKMRKLVQKAINPSSPTATATPSATATTPTKKPGKRTVVPVAPAETGQATDLTAVC